MDKNTFVRKITYSFNYYIFQPKLSDGVSDKFGADNWKTVRIEFEQQ